MGGSEGGVGLTFDPATSDYLIIGPSATREERQKFIAARLAGADAYAQRGMTAEAAVSAHIARIVLGPPLPMPSFVANASGPTSWQQAVRAHHASHRLLDERVDAHVLAGEVGSRQQASWWKKAANTFTAAGDAFGAAVATNRLGQTYAKMGLHHFALEAYRASSATLVDALAIDGVGAVHSAAMKAALHGSLTRTVKLCTGNPHRAQGAAPRRLDATQADALRRALTHLEGIEGYSELVRTGEDTLKRSTQSAPRRIAAAIRNAIDPHEPAARAGQSIAFYGRGPALRDQPQSAALNTPLKRR